MHFFVGVGFWVCMYRSVLGLNFVSVFFGLRCACMLHCGLHVDFALGFGLPWFVVFMGWLFGALVLLIGCAGGSIACSVACSSCLVCDVYWLFVFVCLVVLV